MTKFERYKPITEETQQMGTLAIYDRMGELQQILSKDWDISPEEEENIRDEISHLQFLLSIE